MERLNDLRSLAPTRHSPSCGPLAASKAAGHFRVDPGQPLHLDGDTDLSVEVVEGRIWLTSAGDSQDHFPLAGTRMDFVVGCDLVIEADRGPAVVAVTPRRRGASIGDGLGHGLGFATPGKPLTAVASVIHRATHGFVPLRPAPSRLPAGENPPARRLGLGDWIHAIRLALRQRLTRARDRRLMNTLDSRQLRDIGAADHVIFHREQLEREARMRARMMSDGI